MQRTCVEGGGFGLFGVALMVVLFLAATVPAGLAEDTYKHPRAVIPHVGEARPEVDGKLSDGEYDNFAAITGMVTWGGAGGGLKTIVPRIQQVRWYVGYDEDYLYIAMHSPNPPGVWPLARTKRNDAQRILWDDHTEIQIAKDRSRATFPGGGFYKIMANARGFYNDEWYYNGTPGTEAEWSIGGPLECSVTEDHWQLEMAVDLRAFEVKDLDGKSWVLQLLRADKPGGTYFAGWVGEAWMSWGKFGEVTFDPDAPVLRFLETGRLARGEMDLRFEVLGQGEGEVPVETLVRVTDGDGRSIYEQTKEAVASAGEAKPLRFASDLPLTERGNRIEIRATTAPREGEGRVIYHVQAPIIKLTDAFYAKHIAPWLKGRPKGDLAWNFAYWPSYDVARSAVDTDFFGIREELAEAGAFETLIRSRDGKTTLARSRAAIEDRNGRMVVRDVDLPEGEYAAVLRVFGAEGGKVVDERSIDFVRRHYEWEGNTIGEEMKVIPPFEPIQTDGRALSVWGRTYTVGKGCLPEKIEAGGGAGPEQILTAPVRLSAGSKRRKRGYELKGAEPSVDEVTDAHVDISAEGDFMGAVRCDVHARMEFDGWYRIKMELSSRGWLATVNDRLSLHIPLWNQADTLYVQRAGDGRRGNYFGALPEGRGEVWNSASLLPFGNWGSFAPIVFVGTGDKGVWFLAEENRDWTMSEDRPAIQIFRTDAGVELRLNFFAETTRLERPREIDFALLVDPVKRIPERRKWAWGRNRYAHNTYGYRYWGRSVDGFEQTDEDLRELRRMLTDPEWEIPDKVSGGHSLGHIKAFRNRHHPAVTEGRMLTLYGSTSLTGLGLPAFDTYGGEWLRRTNWKPNPQTEFKGRWNLQCTYRWTTPRELTTVGVNFTPSYEDCFVWHHRRLIENVPVNGTWWDNSSITVISDYDAEREEFYRRFNVYTRRRLTRRLAAMCYELGRRPWWINNMHVDWSFCQVSWHIENDFYVDNAAMTQMDQLSVDEFRAMCRIKRGIIHRLASRGPEGTVEQMRRMGRSQVGMCLLHDIGSYMWGGDKYSAPGMLKILEEKVGFFDGAEFVPYWRNEHMIDVKTAGVYASVYRGKDRAVIVVVNERREDLDVEFDITREILGGRRIKRFYDAETGYALRPEWDREVRRRFWGEMKPGVFGMRAGAVRLFVVE